MMPDSVHYRIRYVINIPEIDSTFVDNAPRMADMREFLAKVRDDSLITVTDVQFRGTASPDGTYDFNVWLSENRLRTFKELVRSYIDIPDSIIHANTAAIPWDEFRAEVVAADYLNHRDEILAIIDEEPRLVPFWGNRRIDARLLKLKTMYGGTVWEQLKSPILRDLRYGDAIFTFTRRKPFRFTPEPTIASLQSLTPPTLAFAPVEFFTWTPRIYIKTNIPAWIMFSANIAVEADLARHWSFSVPFYYCAMDWFKSTIKFRNLSLKPELRYWFRSEANDGFFIGAHFGMAYYNYAFDGDTRYQDYRGRTPALGGGLSFGWRKQISPNNRWRIELAAGAGAYRLDYSLFENTHDVKDGLWKGRRQKTYIGLDDVAVTIAYTIDLQRYARAYRKGGDK